MSGEDPSLRGYRAANDALDERPSAATRAAILAAAARQVQATPRDATEPIAVRAASRSRWPFAAAAAVLLSTLAVMMAVRTEQEMPTFTAPTPGTEARAPAAEIPLKADSSVKAQGAPPGELPPPLAKRAQSGADAGAASGSKSAAPAAVKVAPPERDAGPQIAASEGKVAAPLAEPRAKEEIAALRAPAAPRATPAARSSEAEQPAVARTNAAKPERASADAETAGGERRRNEVTDGAAAAGIQLRQETATLEATGKARSEADAKDMDELPAEDWLKKIIKLRKSGRHDEADAELKRFRERYPQVEVPADALPPSGTR